MEAYGKILNVVIPIFFVLFFIEKIAERIKGVKIERSLDSVSSFSSGITNVVKDVLGMSISIITYSWMVEKWSLVRLEATWQAYLIAFIAVDFQGYWIHRWSHEINFLWNRHIIHHSSEEYNLACALRQSVSTIINYFTILLLPAALLGVPPVVIAVVGPLHLFMQYWYHTRLVGRLGWLEYIIVTPSQHRVHHAINPEYMDKNYGQIFCLWDRIFGSFQEELPDVPPQYGVTRPVRTWNPIKINFQHFWLMLTDAWRTRSWWDKLRVWFMPTGWRPDDVKAKYPVFSIRDVPHYEKYDTPASRSFKIWCWIQLFFNYALLVYFFAFLGKISQSEVLLYGAIIFINIFAYTELMDRHRYAMYLEIAKSAFALGLIWYQGGDWFGARTWVGFWFVIFVAVYMVVSAVAAVWFATVEMQSAQRQDQWRMKEG